MELTFGYEQHEGFGDNPQHVWFAKNEQGAVHIWARLYAYPAGNYPPEWIGGIECHWAKCPDNTGWFNPDEPSQPECWLLKAPCWHDGSSLYFNESLARCLPVPWGDDPNSEVERATDYFNATMLRWHRDRIGEMRAETPLYASPQPYTDCAALRDEVERLREANGILEDALQEVGDDYPGSSCQEWCQQQVKAARAALNGGNHDA